MSSGKGTNKSHDPRINYRGKNASRLDNLTDAVFGIAITLLIFSVTNPNSFSDLLLFTKTLPAFLISISFLIMLWHEHHKFSEIYTLNDFRLTVLNTLFIGMVIFYVYPLKFLTLFLTNFFFGTDVAVKIDGWQVPDLMIYYSSIALVLRLILFLFYLRATQLKELLEMNDFEVFYTNSVLQRMFIMFLVPLLSIVIVILLKDYSPFWASVLGGISYSLYTPLILLWARNYERKAETWDL